MEYANKLINETISTRFLGMQINNYLNWKKHIDQILPKPSTACFSIRRLFHIPNIDVLRMVYFAYFHSIIKYGLSGEIQSINTSRVFTLKKRIIMSGVGANSSCGNLFKKLDFYLYRISTYKEVLIKDFSFNHFLYF